MEYDNVTKRRLSTRDPKKMRNLMQYRNLTDDEFDEVMERKNLGIVKSQEFEARIERKIGEFGKDYDLDDLNSNDRLTLRALAQAMINLEDYEDYEYALRKEGVNDGTILLIEKLSKIKSDLRSDISKLSDDLKITRKVRKADKEQSVITYLEDLKKKAKEFYESKMQLIFCPKCNTWIGSVWTLFPSDPRNKVSLYCDRDMGDGQKCGEKVVVYTAELLKNGGTNKADIPDSVK